MDGQYWREWQKEMVDNYNASIEMCDVDMLK